MVCEVAHAATSHTGEPDRRDPQKEMTEMINTKCIATLAAVSAAALITAAPAPAQQQNRDEATWVDITSWDTAHLYRGWSADDLLNEAVYGRYGERIGEVEDFIIGPDGMIKKVIVEGGGFLDIGDSHVAVNWSDVTRNGSSSITVPLTEETLEDYGLFRDMDDVRAAGENWRLRNLMGDYLTLRNGVGYGHVSDVIFSQEGKIEAVVAEGAHGYGYPRGPLAFPYYSRDYNPYQAYYETPYTKVQLENIRPFNYGSFERR